jgi:hypothetical protein
MSTNASLISDATNDNSPLPDDGGANQCATDAEGDPHCDRWRPIQAGDEPAQGEHGFLTGTTIITVRRLISSFGRAEAAAPKSAIGSISAAGTNTGSFPGQPHFEHGAISGTEGFSMLGEEFPITASPRGNGASLSDTLLMPHEQAWLRSGQRLTSLSMCLHRSPRHHVGSAALAGEPHGAPGGQRGGFPSPSHDLSTPAQRSCAGRALCQAVRRYGA